MNNQDETNQQQDQDPDQDAEEVWNFENEGLDFNHGQEVDQGTGQGQQGNAVVQEETPQRGELPTQVSTFDHEQVDQGRVQASVSTPGLRSIPPDRPGNAEEGLGGISAGRLYDELEHTPSSDTIHYDDSSPRAVPSRRSEDPITDVTRDARRFSSEHFQSPTGTVPGLGPRRTVPPPGVQRFTRPTVPGLEERRFTMPTGVDLETPLRRNPQFATDAMGGHPDHDPPSSSSSSRQPSRSSAPSPVLPPQMRRENAAQAGPNASRARQLILQGCPLTLRTTPLDYASLPSNAIWNKLKRHELSAEDRLAFEAKAGGYVLGKNNKLRLLTQTAEDDEILTKNYNLQYQVLALKQHCHEHDIGDCMRILKPDSHGFPMLTEYNLFDDYMKIDPVVVAQSNTLYHRYVVEPYVGQNITLIYNMLKNNTQETLFFQCLELYLKYHPMQQGGPLMWSLILQKISSRTEQQLDYLKTKVKQLRISSLEGENVDKTVSLLDAALSTFKAASTPTTNRIPQEWNKDLLTIFQTSSVSTFNSLFLKIQQDVRQAADMEGVMPQWPDHEEIIRLASATYNRLKLSGEWDVPASSQKKAMVVEVRRPFKPNDNQPRPDPTCWNCGIKGHKLQQCPKPLDQAKIDKKRVEWKSNRRDRFNNNSNSNSRYQNNRRANVAVKSKSKNKDKDKPERAAAPQVNMAAQYVDSRGYTNRNLEDIAREIL